MEEKHEDNDSTKSKRFCCIGKFTNDDCADKPTRGKSLVTCKYSECNEDISSYILSIHPGLTSDDVQKCVNVNEKWLIRNRLQECALSHNDVLCGKHRAKYGLGYKAPAKCMHPSHCDLKEKKTGPKAKKTVLTAMTAQHIKEISVEYSSVVKKVILPHGAQWCNRCRLARSQKEATHNEASTEICMVCSEHHSEQKTPQKRSCASRLPFTLSHEVFGTPCSSSTIESQEEFLPLDSSKETFNESMKSISNTWTPVKYQVRKTFDTLDKKTKSALVRKGSKAIDTVLEQIAPGQADCLKDEILKTYVQVDIAEELKEAMKAAVGNVKIQLISIIAGKTDGRYQHTINNLQAMFPGTSKHYIEKARIHAAAGNVGMPIESGLYHRKKLKDYQVDHFLDFMQQGGFVQDVASGTRRVTLSSGRKSVMPNVVRTVHKAEIIRLYEGFCEKEGYIEERPSTRTLWNILKMCPASQRKSLAGLDNVAAEGSDAFDTLHNNLRSILMKCPERREEIEQLEASLIKGKRYLKGEYKSHCRERESTVADHCRKFALSDPNDKDYQEICNHQHDQPCYDCEELKDALERMNTINIEKFTAKELGIMQYEISEAVKSIEIWKAHILAIINQDTHKQDIIKTIDTNPEAALIIIDFAMKFLSKRYRESMAKWFGKAGNGMHVMCVIFKHEEQLLKRTYIAFIGKSPQNVGSVMAIYETCLMQIRRDSPQIKYLIDKSDNAGCYHTEVLFAWKAQWPPSNTGHTFWDTTFNERQAGKDQCDRDSATSKRQMNYYVNKGNNIESPLEMQRALRTATGLCGFNSCVIGIESEDAETTEYIKKIAKIHHVKYLKEGGKLWYHVWQYYGIGKGKKFPVGTLPCSSKYEVSIPFEEDHLSFGVAMAKKKNKQIPIHCSETMCCKSFVTVDKMLYHLDYEEHEYDPAPNVTQLSKVSDKWVQRFSGEKSEASSTATQSHKEIGSYSSNLDMGWAIPKRCNRRLNVRQKNFLNKLFDDGEKNKNKISAELALHKMKNTFEPQDFLPVTSIKSYFSRRAKKLRDGKCVLGEVIEDGSQEDEVAEIDEVDSHEHDEELDQNAQLKEWETREKVTNDILSQLDLAPNLQKDEWIAVNMGSVWYPAQFEKYDVDQEELLVNFLHRSSSNSQWFVWPQLQIDGTEDRSWISEDKVFYRLSEPKEGRRQTLLFDDVGDVDKVFEKYKN